MHDEHPLGDIYRRHGPAVFRRARQMLGVDAEAHEIVQDVFLSLLESPQQFAGRSALTTYLYSATTHACLNRVRNRKHRDRLQQQRSDEAAANDVDCGLTPEELLMLHRAIEDLPDELAQVAVYYLVDGLTQQEIARLLDCSRRHVGDLLVRLRQWERSREVAPC
jgi:RNA polymerase sigma-70 factor (ECF subfamily)